jgi:phosphoglycolate phosphatase
VGDSAVDIQTAKAARIAAVGAVYGYRSREELELAGADYLITSPPELLSIVEFK